MYRQPDDSFNHLYEDESGEMYVNVGHARTFPFSQSMENVVYPCTTRMFLLCGYEYFLFWKRITFNELHAFGNIFIIFHDVCVVFIPQKS